MKVAIDISFDGDKDVFLPGDEIAGTVRFTPEKPCSLRSTMLRILWYTMGKGDTDEGVFYETDLTGGCELLGEETYPFKARLPDFPLSFSGTLIKLHWAVRVHLDIKWARDASGEVRFILTDAVAEGEAVPPAGA